MTVNEMYYELFELIQAGKGEEELYIPVENDWDGDIERAPASILVAEDGAITIKAEL